MERLHNASALLTWHMQAVAQSPDAHHFVPPICAGFWFAKHAVVPARISKKSTLCDGKPALERECTPERTFELVSKCNVRDTQEQCGTDIVGPLQDACHSLSGPIVGRFDQVSKHLGTSAPAPRPSPVYEVALNSPLRSHPAAPSMVQTETHPARLSPGQPPPRTFAPPGDPVVVCLIRISLPEHLGDVSA